MKIGFVTFYEENKTAQLASQLGFNCIEAFVEKNTELNLDEMTADKLNRIMTDMSNNNLVFNSISLAPTHLHTDQEIRKENMRYFKKAISMCRDFGTNVVVTNAMCDRTLNMEQNIELYKNVFGEYAELAEKCGVVIGIENCPHYNGSTFGNIAFSPEMFEAMFEAVDSKAIGLEFDPSHLYWQQIDYLAMLNQFSDRVYSIHAKDTEIINKNLKRYGIFGCQLPERANDENTWWRYRIPGLGEIDFPAIFKILRDNNYKGNIVIEHEDSVFGWNEEGTAQDSMEVFKKGLSKGLTYLRSL